MNLGYEKIIEGDVLVLSTRRNRQKKEVVATVSTIREI